MRSTFLLVIRLALGAVLLWSGISKIRHPYDFLNAVYGYQLVGPTTGMVVAALVPWLEMVTGGCLMGGVMLSGAALASVVIGIVITFATSSALSRGLKITCGCFGGTGSTIDFAVVLRSGMLLATAISLLVLAQMEDRQTRPK